MGVKPGKELLTVNVEMYSQHAVRCEMQSIIVQCIVYCTVHMFICTSMCVRALIKELRKALPISKNQNWLECQYIDIILKLALLEFQYLCIISKLALLNFQYIGIILKFAWLKFQQFGIQKSLKIISIFQYIDIRISIFPNLNNSK